MPDTELAFELDRFLPFRLLNVTEQISLQFAERYRRKYSMTRPEWRTFAILGEHEHITAKEIGRISHMHKTKVSRAIASLTKRGWLHRSRNDDDRRMEHLKLSAIGQRNYAKLIKEAHEFNSDIESKLGPDAMATIWQAVAHLDRLQN